MKPAKLYLVTRADLPPGQQAIQAAHALAEFMVEHPTLAREWHDASNTLVMLTVRNERALKNLWGRACHICPGSRFHEPDRSNEMTAMAIAPTNGCERICRNLPLALQAPVA